MKKAGGLLLFLALVAFGNSLRGPFHYDDLHSVQYNPHIRSLERIPSFFVDPSTFSSQARGFMYRPLLLTSYAVDYAAWGQNVTGFRATNLVIHGAASAAFGLLAWLILGSVPGAMIAACLFVLHPVHAEVVNYISARSDALVACLYLGVCAAALRRRQLAVVVGYGASLLAKSVAVTLPAMLIMFSGWPSSSRPGGERRGAIAIVFLTAGYLAILWSSRFLQHSADLFPRQISAEIWTQLKGLVYYIWLLVVPARLSVDHPFAVGSATDLSVLFALAVVSSAIVLSLRFRLSVPGVATIWFGVCMLPYLVLPLNVLVAERRVYLASAGALLLMTWAWQQLAERRGRAVGWVGVALLATCLVLTVQRNDVWASETTLWTDAVEKNPISARARINLALAYRRQDDAEATRHHLKEGLRLDPEFAEGWVIAGDLAKDAGRMQEAQRAYERAARIDPGMEGVQHNLGNIAFAQARYHVAIDRYRETLKINPHFAEARNNLGQALEATGQPGLALVQYEQAVADSSYWIHTDDPVGGAWYNLARLADRLQDTDKAKHAFAQTIHYLSGDPRYSAFVDYARARQAELGGVESGS